MVVTRAPQTGFTYLGVLFAIALMGIALGAVGTLWQTEMQREREKELLFIGNEFRNAIKQYYHRSPGVGSYPKELKVLLKDPRLLNNQRHLRRLYTDPMTGKPEWGLIRTPDKGIMGVYSLSQGKPIKKANFSAADKGFDSARSYRDWRFVYTPSNTPATTTQKYY